MNDFHRDRQAASLGDKLLARWDRLARSGFVTFAAVLLALALGGGLWMAHLKGRIHQLTTTQDVAERATSAPRPGGQDLARLTRFNAAGTLVPELTGATFAPGDGMLLLQAALTVPGNGEQPLLAGTPEDRIAVLGDSLNGAELSARVQTREGARWSTPVELIAGHASSQQETNVVAGGSRAVARFSADVPGTGAAPSKGVEAVVNAALTNHGLQLSITVKNVSPGARGVTVAWRVPLLAPRAGVRTAAIVPPAQAAGASAQKTELLLGRHDVDQTFAPLQQTYLSAGPELLLRLPAEGYNLQFTALTPSIRSVRVQAAQQAGPIAITFSTALGGQSDEQPTVIAPGETLQWRMRMEATASEPAPSPAP